MLGLRSQDPIKNLLIEMSEQPTWYHLPLAFSDQQIAQPKADHSPAFPPPANNEVQNLVIQQHIAIVLRKIVASLPHLWMETRHQSSNFGGLYGCDNKNRDQRITYLHDIDAIQPSYRRRCHLSGWIFDESTTYIHRYGP